MAEFKLYPYFSNMETGAERDEEGKLVHTFRFLADLKRGPAVQGAILEFTLNGEAVGQEQTDDKGTAFVECELHTNALFALGKVKMAEYPFLEKPVRINFPKPEKKPEEYPHLKVTKSIEIDGEKMRIFLTRTDSKGKPLPGKIIFLDQYPEKNSADPQEIDSVNGMAHSDFPMSEREREIIFYVPERPNDVTPFEIPKIPAKPKRALRKKPEPRFWEQLKAARRKGLGLEE